MKTEIVKCKNIMIDDYVLTGTNIITGEMVIIKMSYLKSRTISEEENCSIIEYVTED
jgi:hypothetical protein